MTHYISLTNQKEPDTKINFCWGADCGCWINHPTPLSRTVAHMIVHEVQDKTRHNRKRMANRYQWERIMNKYIGMYNLLKEEVTT